MARYFVHLCYDGSDYCGWQRQNNARSVQDTCEKVLSILLGEREVNIIGCGRTDTGVHANSYYFHFDTELVLPIELEYRMNAMLPKSIAINDIFKVEDNLHARFDAKNRSYKYFIHRKKSPFREKYSFALPHIDLDLVRMNDFCKYLIGKKDFTAFEKKGSDNKTSTCEVYEALWEEEDGNLVFTITADRFLRNMVRAITGTSLMIGSGRVSLEDIARKIQDKQQINVTLAVPAHGLHLWSIRYDFDKYGRS